MDFVNVCSHCGKTISREFLYCPWCGMENADPSDSAVLENLFGQLEQKQLSDRASRVRKIESQISEIEKGLDIFLGK